MKMPSVLHRMRVSQRTLRQRCTHIRCRHVICSQCGAFLPWHLVPDHETPKPNFPHCPRCYSGVSLSFLMQGLFVWSGLVTEDVHYNDLLILKRNSQIGA